jgi:hypothetical protein
MTEEFYSFYYQPLMLSSAAEYNVIAEMLAHYHKICAESKYSEYLDLNNHTKKRSVVKCRSFHRSWEAKPFEFAYCMN